MAINMSVFNFSILNSTETQNIFYDEGVKALNTALGEIAGRINGFLWISAVASFLSCVFIIIAIKKDDSTLLYHAIGLNFIACIYAITPFFVRF